MFVRFLSLLEEDSPTQLHFFPSPKRLEESLFPPCLTVSRIEEELFPPPRGQVGSPIQSTSLFWPDFSFLPQIFLLILLKSDAVSPWKNIVPFCACLKFFYFFSLQWRRRFPLNRRWLGSLWRSPKRESRFSSPQRCDLFLSHAQPDCVPFFPLSGFVTPEAEF